MVICGVCKKELKMLNNAHLKYHGLTPAEYDDIHPDKPRYDIEVRRNMGIKTGIKSDLFKNLDNKNTWLIGLLTADGSFGGKGQPNVLQLYNTDYGLVNEFRKITNSSKRIYERKNMPGQLGNKTVYHLAISNIDLITQLKSINAHGDKDKRNPFKNIPDEFKWSFIKGLFDGDGNFYKGQFSIAGRKELIEDVYYWICKQLEKEPNKVYQSSTSDKTFYFQLAKTDTEIVYRLIERNTNGTYNSKKYKQLEQFYDIGEGLLI